MSTIENNPTVAAPPAVKFAVTYAGLPVAFVKNLCGFHFNIAARGRHDLFETEDLATLAAVRSGMKLFKVVRADEIF